MKAVLISVRPKWCELIASGKKTLEVRKTKPKLSVPFKVYIYCTYNGGALHSAYDGLHHHKSYVGKEDSSFINGKVIGEFICDGILSHCEMGNADIAEQQGCIKREELLKYSNGKELYGWHISDLKIYEQPKDLREFRLYNLRAYYDEELRLPMPTHEISRPPQSWCYVEELQG